MYSRESNWESIGSPRFPRPTLSPYEPESGCGAIAEVQEHEPGAVEVEYKSSFRHFTKIVEPNTQLSLKGATL